MLLDLLIFIIFYYEHSNFRNKCFGFLKLLCSEWVNTTTIIDELIIKFLGGK